MMLLDNSFLRYYNTTEKIFQESQGKNTENPGKNINNV